MHSGQGAAPSSPPERGGGGNQSQLSLLGQQLRGYNPSQRQQPLPPPPSTVGFVSGPQPQTNNHSTPYPRQEVVSDKGEAFHGLSQIFPFGGGQEYGSHLNVQANSGGSSMVAAEKAESHAFMTALLIVQQKIAHLQTLVQLIAQGGQSNVAITHQQMATAAAVANCISQLVVAAAGMIPDQSNHPSQFMNDAQIAQLIGGVTFHQGSSSLQQNAFASPLGTVFGNTPFLSNSLRSTRKEPVSLGLSFAQDLLSDRNVQQLGFQIASPRATAASRSPLGTSSGIWGAEAAGTGRSAGMEALMSITEGSTSEQVGNYHNMARGAAEVSMNIEDPDTGGAAGCKDEDEDYTELLPPGSYDLIEPDAMEILAEHTHFCDICGKGFKRDANLRMHMRGHGDEYKTVAALAKPDKSLQDTSTRKPLRYSCPYVGCKRNKKHRKFQPLKTMLCVKNHYRRSHCPKMLTCGKCKAKNFSVVADLKTHEKHCGREKWQCSCGTTFSRKDKLFGHIGLFIGHTPAPRTHKEASSSASVPREGSAPVSGSNSVTESARVVLNMSETS